MRNFLVIIFLAFVIFSIPIMATYDNLSRSASSDASLSSSSHAKLEHVPGEVIVKFKDSGKKTSDALGISDLQNINTKILNAKHKIERIDRLANRTNLYLMKFGKNKSVEDVVNDYKKDPSIEYAEPNYILEIRTTPNDPSFSSQYHHTNLDSKNAWNITTGNTTVVIAIIDTGVEWNHSDLSDNIWNNTDETVNSTDDDNNNYTDDIRGFDFV